MNISFDPRAAAITAQRAARAQADAEFAADMDRSGELISAYVKVAVLFTRVHAPVLTGAGLLGVTVSILAMWLGIA